MNWQDMAVKTAELYMTEYSLSRAELIEQLEIDGFPTEDAIYAADNCGISWN
ncbi:MAG: Ltp family lipoprotein [Ruminiclostridium sp.]|nr:Ltp family lipoprotein [Ruminiclostridium sp.]